MHIGFKVKPTIGGGGGWTPTTPGTPELWLDGKVSGSFTFHSGSIISQWADQSGNGRHAANATSTNSPTRDTTTYGSSTVRFQQFPNNQWLGYTGTDFFAGGPLTVAVVCRQESAGSARMFSMRASGGQDFNDSAGGALGSEAGDFPSGYRNGAIASGPNFDDTFDLYWWRFDGTNSYAYDGVSGTEHGPTANGGTFAVDEYRLAGAAQGGDYSFCWIGEVIVWEQSLGSTDRSSLISYMNTKWGV